jgi:hypothetical protein
MEPNIMKINSFRMGLVACGVLAAVTLAGCHANGPGYGSPNGTGGNGNGTGAITGGGPSSPTIVNNGTTPTDITNGGTQLTGNFVCTDSAQEQYGATTQVSVNGLIGSSLTPVLNQLGATTATTLLNSVINPYYAIDGNLDTYSTFSLTAGAFSGVDSVGQTILLPAGNTVPAGGFAVFAVQFPPGTVTASIVSNVTVTTFLNSVAQESITYSENQIALLGNNATGTTSAFIGVQATKPYDSANISLTPSVLSADVGDAMQVDELCTGGTLKQ